jgi:hypothetical protein
MTDRLETAAARVVAEAEKCKLLAVREWAEAAVDESERELAALDRIEAAGAELERLERLYPGRSSTREMLTDAGVTCSDVGLEESDPELIDKWMVEERLR